MTAAVLPPGPKQHLFVGNLPEFGKDILGFFTMLGREYGDISAIRLAGWDACFVNHPDYIEDVLLTNNKNFIKHTFFFRHVTEIFGKGLLTNEGAGWLRQRRLAQPAFHRERIAGYGDVMVAHTDRMLATWKEGQTLDVHHEMMRVTMEIVTKTLFGVEISGEVAEEVGAVFNDTVEVIANRFRRPFMVPRWIPIPDNVRYRRAVKRLDRLVYGVIEERKATPGDDLLSLLMAARDEDDGTGMDEKQLRDEAITIFLAGHETTAIALSWTFMLLAQHPEAEAKLVRELSEVLGDRPPTASDLPRLPYTTNVVTESMRLYPPAYAMGREALEDFELGGYVFPKGTTVYIAPWVIHRDPRYYDDPLTFHPERWENNFAKKLPRFVYLPFGGGPRLCIGNSFAMMEAILILARVIQKFRLSLVPNQTIEPFPSITLRPKYGIRMTLARRGPVAGSW